MTKKNMHARRPRVGGDWSGTTPEELTDSFLRSGAENTRKAYRFDLGQFRDFLGVGDMVQAAKTICDMPAGAASRTIRDYVSWLRGKELSANTVRRRIGSLLGLAAKAKAFDVLQWSVRISLPSPAPIRDVSGPNRLQVLDMIEVCRMRDDAKGIRDAAIVSLMFFNALRSGELLSIDVEHYDSGESTVSVRAKRRWDREIIHVPRRSRRAVNDWLEARGAEPGPMFVSFNACLRGEKKRLTYRGLYELIQGIGLKVGVRCRPHALRHGAVTEILRLTGGDIFQAMNLTRHRNPKTLLAYVDSLNNKGRSVAEILSAGYPVSGWSEPDEDKV